MSIVCCGTFSSLRLSGVVFYVFSSLTFFHPKELYHQEPPQERTQQVLGFLRVQSLGFDRVHEQGSIWGIYKEFRHLGARCRRDLPEGESVARIGV